MTDKSIKCKWFQSETFLSHFTIMKNISENGIMTSFRAALAPNQKVISRWAGQTIKPTVDYREQSSRFNTADQSDLFKSNIPLHITIALPLPYLYLYLLHITLRLCVYKCLHLNNCTHTFLVVQSASLLFFSFSAAFIYCACSMREL